MKDHPVVTVEDIARVCHEANRGYCSAIGDNSQSPWEEAAEWQRQSSIAGVRFLLENPSAGPGAAHKAWAIHKYADGWMYGATKDEAKKTHPCLIQFIDLPVAQQAKDFIFVAIVRAMAPGLHE